MIGNICITQTKYYDALKKKNNFKYRPALINAGPRNNDYTILPISSISISSNIDVDYDIKIDPKQYPNLKLRKTCYIRTHKSTTMHKAEILKIVINMKSIEHDLYIHVIKKYEQWAKEIVDNA